MSNFLENTFLRLILKLNNQIDLSFKQFYTTKYIS